ncbi:Histidine phosphatase superfamily clade-1 [Penicillium fimorum]|uniref:Histidine phosphatase superfamily clade-1 n=1 Tax=Penicillium fimorum TaxID=1882269 RepID=A0A9X0C1S9_9EURO|nr:Histidine phosphatase superfamily clade-1 [Penicillium fimorum]
MRLSTISSALVGLAVAQASTIKYSVVPGYFLQDEESTDPSTFDYTAENFGLIGRAYPADKDSRKHKSLTQWERFYNQVNKLNDHSPPHVEYKVLFLGRHGEGYHNAAESYYGTPAWNCYWSELDGNGTSTWADAALTPEGSSQALKANAFWQKEINEQRIHTPDVYYVSPMTRTLQTANLTFTGLDLPKHSASFKPTIKELFRESISVHTCDHRRSRNYIHSLFPHWRIEQGFSEEDELWNGVTGESSGAQDIRSAQALGDVFFSSSKKNSFVSITSHSGEISSLLRVVGHRTFKLNTGSVIPVLVRAEKVHGKAPVTSVPWDLTPHCTEPPVASVTVCICPSSAVPVTTPLATGF